MNGFNILTYSIYLLYCKEKKKCSHNISKSNLTYCSREKAKYSTTRDFADYTQPIYLDEVSCNGTEDNLLKCHMNKIGFHDCRHDEDVSVICQGNITYKMWYIWTKNYYARLDFSTGKWPISQTKKS